MVIEACCALPNLLTFGRHVSDLHWRIWTSDFTKSSTADEQLVQQHVK